MVFATLKNITGISSRVYPQRIPEGKSWPAISYYVISTTPEEVKNTATSPIDLVRIQVSIFDTTQNSVNTIADLARVAMVALTGEQGTCTVDTVRLVDERDFYEEDIQIYHKAQDYYVRIKN